VKPLDTAKANVTRIARALRQAADGHGGATVNTNISGRRNIIVSGSLGRDGSVHYASAKQQVRVRQDANGSVEETVTTHEELVD
jgi:hypothetical protein